MPDLGLTDWYIYGGSDHKYDKLYGSIPSNRLETDSATGAKRRPPLAAGAERIVAELTEQIRTENDP